jgi:adenine-specific DNA-methyltransferase
MGRAGAKLARLSAAIDAERAAERATGDDLVAALHTRTPVNADDPEALYREIVPIGRRKRLGQYFTPAPVAGLMVRWIAEIQPRTVLDPAVGPGIFPRLLHRSCPDAAITAIDVDPVALGVARSALAGDARVSLVEADFLTWSDASEFDAVIANPPYLRHHDMAYAFDVFATIGRRNDIALSRLTNLYVLFILEICRRLRAGGRAAIVVPGEWMNANFGSPLKEWLLARGLLHTIIYWSHAATVFSDALTTASVLLIDKSARARAGRRVRTIYVHDGAPIEAVAAALTSDTATHDALVVQTLEPAMLLAHAKWNEALGHGVRPVPPGFTALATLATTRRGIATGANRFFHLRPSDVARLGVRAASARPCVGRAADVRGCVFSADDYEALVTADARCRLLDIEDEPTKDERTYLALGEQEGIERRYLCAARRPAWYRMERRPAAPIWAGVFARNGMRFVWNAAGVANLTAFHCIYPHDDDALFAAALTACLNGATVQDLARRHVRVYGAGLAKVEPRDLLQIPVPDLRRVSAVLRQRLRDALITLDRADAGRRSDVARTALDELVVEAADSVSAP